MLLIDDEEDRMSEKLSSEQRKALAGIEELHRIDLEASRTRDFEALLSLWTEDGVLLMPEMRPVVGKEAIRSYMGKQAAVSRTYTIREYEHFWQEIKIFDDWACEWGYFSGEVEMVDSGEIVRQKGKLLRILKRQEDGSWKCARAIGHYDDPKE